MKTLAVLQPSYLPWMGYFDQIARSDYFVFYDDVGFDKNGWRNRNRILGKRGPEWITVPVTYQHKNQPLNQIGIDQRQPWSRKHLGQIRHNYSKAPYFKEIFPQLEGHLSELAQCTCLIDVCIPLISWINKILEIPTPIFRSSSLNITGDQSGRLINLCKFFGATNYLSGNAAQAYLDANLFSTSGISVEWQNYEHPIYDQGGREYTPFLSIIDLLMFVGEKNAAVYFHRNRQITTMGLDDTHKFTILSSL